ncbi:UNVERIFIED_CONTAM: hypothetical protein GTU68_023730 [Idotea baltica]|nr:hypothetical protein [Idotea baltica]
MKKSSKPSKTTGWSASPWLTGTFFASPFTKSPFLITSRPTPRSTKPSKLPNDLAQRTPPVL